MKVFLVFILAAYGMHHVLSPKTEKADGVTVSASDWPAGFDPSSMTSSQKAQMRSQLEREIERLDAFIANPPVST